uniref:Uncharacterized protein n=1 Tax=Anopheles coluzzii TaxID=1518534 RepID=A0A8W7P7Z4_ANOCL
LECASKGQQQRQGAMASGDTAAIDTIDVESALSTKNSEFTASSKDQPLELDEYGKFIKDTPGKFIMADGSVQGTAVIIIVVVRDGSFASSSNNNTGLAYPSGQIWI